MSNLIEPDTKDWTWILERACPECGFVAKDVEPGDLASRLRENADAWAPVLAAPEAATRPDPAVWSPVEYACHVRDVHLIFAQRLAQMLTEDEPHFANWDQDETAVAERYDEQDPAVVGVELTAAAEAVAATYDGVPEDSWQRSGVRSDGSVFTVESLGRYHLHDVVHHAWDVRDVGISAP